MSLILNYVFSNQFLLFLGGIIFGILLIDFGIAFNLSYKIRKLLLNTKVKRINLSFSEFRKRTKIELNEKFKNHFKNHLKNKGVR
jgi:hypothetical protein